MGDFNFFLYSGLYFLIFHINHSYNQENANGYFNYRSIDRVNFGLYNFKYVKNAHTEQSVHKCTEILRMVVQVAGV